MFVALAVKAKQFSNGFVSGQGDLSETNVSPSKHFRANDCRIGPPDTDISVQDVGVSNCQADMFGMLGK